MIATTDALSGVTTYGFDWVGNQTSVTDPDGNTTTFLYNGVNLQTEMIDPLTHSSTMAYDAGNRLTSVTDRDGRIDDYAYDKDNRLIGTTWIVGGTTVNLFTYTYDADSNELTAANYAGTYTMGYDVLDRPTSIQEPFGLTLTFAYDKDGNRTQVTDSFGGLTSYVYDNDNQLTTEEFGGTGQTPLRINFAYDVGGELTTITRYSNLAGTATVILTVETYTLDGMVKNIEQKNSSGTILENFTYTYDADDRVYTETDNGTLETYTYDADGELLGNGTESYSYDANGNRTNTGYTNSVNQITTDGTWDFSYDAEGNLTKAVSTATAGMTVGQTWIYTYDNDNRLIGATDSQTTQGLLVQATYIYDALNNRIEKDVDSSGTTTVQRYGYDVSTVPSPSVGGVGTEGATDLNAVPLNIWVDLNSSDALETRYLWGGQGLTSSSTSDSAMSQVDRLFARISSAGTAAWYVDDRLGSVRNITNNSGTLTDTITYDPFGNVLTETSTSNGDRYKFAGMQLDSETGLSYDLDRYYDTTRGRFMTEDPSGLGPDTNPYRYVGNDPVRRTDPTGLKWVQTGRFTDAIRILRERVSFTKGWYVRPTAGRAGYERKPGYYRNPNGRYGIYDFEAPNHPDAPLYKYILDGRQQNISVVCLFDHPQTRWAWEWKREDDPPKQDPVSKPDPLSRPLPPITPLLRGGGKVVIEILPEMLQRAAGFFIIVAPVQDYFPGARSGPQSGA